MTNNKFKIPYWRTSFGEEEIQHVVDSIRNEKISQGTVTAEFEQLIAKLIDVPHVFATTSGSTAILMALIAAGISPGDEIIVPNRTWIATSHAPHLLGAKVVLVDVQIDQPTMDVTQIEQHITSRTKAIIPVHLNGRSVDMKSVNRIAREHGLLVIEDAAQALCSTNNEGFLGCQSFAGCFSLSVTKLISTGQGGFIVTKNDEVYERLKLMRTHGISDVINPSYTEFGFNFRFTDILASVGIEQLKRIPDRIERLKAIYLKYANVMDKLPFLKLIPNNIDKGEIPIHVEVLCPFRDELVEFLASKSIQVRSFYPDLDTADYFGCDREFLHSRKFGEQGLFLPGGPDQPLENIEKVIDTLRSFRRSQ